MNENLTSGAWLQRDGADRVLVTGNCSLGRVIGNDVVLVDDRVSRRHATIHVQGEQEFWLIDLGSRNGTYLNGRRVSQPTRLREGDRLQIGPFTLVFRQPLSANTSRQNASTVSEQTQIDFRSSSCWLLLCDIMGSSSLSQRKSGEELAMIVGSWFGRCKEAIEDQGGAINKYLGDGLLAYWPARDDVIPHVAQALRDLQRLQHEAQPPFRLVLHSGDVLLGGIPSSGEESLAGPEVNFIFRLERLSSDLRLERVCSATAARKLKDLLPTNLAGEYPLSGFEGRYPVFTF